MSTWNMPPGVTTNEIPGNGSADQLEAEYIKQCGEMMTETIVDTILDACPLERETKRDDVRPALIRALAAANLSDLDVARWAGSLVGNPDFEAWMGDQE